MKFFQNKNKGFSLVEMLLYVAILTLMLVVIINILVTIVSSQRTIAASKVVENSGIFSLERIVRELRNASSVVVASSTLGVSPGVLVLNGADSDGNSRSTKFSVVGGVLHFTENGEDKGMVTQPGATVTSLIFNLISGTTTQMIRTRITIEAGTSTSYHSDNFYSTVLLRGSL